MRSNNVHMYTTDALTLHDRALTAILAVYIALTLLMLGVAGAAVWPVVISAMRAESALAPVFRTLLAINLALVVLYGLLSAFMLWFDKQFSFKKQAVIHLLLGGTVNLVFLCMHSGAFLAAIAGESSTMMLLFWFILSFFLSCVLSFLPAAAVAAVAKCIHAVFFFFH